jgi:site-specific DNA-methyltransferase (adenine-specific)
MISLEKQPMKDYINITCEDNMELMARYPDNYFDLAIVDPPYGIGAGNMRLNNPKYKKRDWDSNVPTLDYFKELFRVSKNQVVWGANYFGLPPNRCFIVWDKKNPVGNSFSMAEYAWASFDSKPLLFSMYSSHVTQGKRIHPTQKPVELYSFTLTNYAKPGDKILDTHIGSGSIAIAIDSVNKIEKMNLTLTGCELDPEYYAKAMERISAKTSQKSLFNADL